jgi:hypothetical protein
MILIYPEHYTPEQAASVLRDIAAKLTSEAAQQRQAKGGKKSKQKEISSQVETKSKTASKARRR